MPEEIVAIYRGDVIIPLKKLNIPSGSRIKLLIEKVDTKEPLKELGYLKLLHEGEDAGELFEF
ncbi:antitoxin family protein [Thermococcus sp.]|uniref:antitoxin family protein n=1 Tax=Thermococcus sp. TaxID=35749 RepID=UPI002606E027|nr:antitoxin family protein [Thermococcus sp.]